MEMTSTQPMPRAFGEQIWEFEQPLPRGIVVAVDQSPESVEAFKMASEISVHGGLRLHVISVIPVSPTASPVPALTGELSRTELLGLDRRAFAIKDIIANNRNGAHVTYEVTIGDVTRSIVSAAECRGASLIVSGRTHHNSFERLMGNETTLHLMKASHIPVLAVCSASRSLKHVVVATDFSDSSIKAAQVAVDLMNGEGTIHLVYVDEPGDTIAGEPAGRGWNAPVDVVAWFRRTSSSLAANSKLRVEPTVLSGDPVETLLEFSERIGADLIAAGSHGYSRFERLFLGSVSTALVRRSPFPILVARDDN
jgi:nucleotide-binding universal stress UspA family protein